MTSTYGLAGERLSLSLPGGGTWTYGYDRANVIGCLSKDDPNSLSHSLATLNDDQGRRIDVYLDQSGRCWETLNNEAFSGTNLVSYTDTLYTFDTLHLWLTQLQNTYHYQNAQQQWQSKLLVQNNYTLDNAGQRLTNQISSLDPMTGNPTSRTELYGYDTLNRLTTADYGDGQTQGYTFDQMGNRLTKTDNSTGNESYAFNAANMLTSRTVAGTASSYTNDADGNTLTGGGRTNTWDSVNRMVKCVNGTSTSTFTYGADGIRHSSVVNGVSTDFVLDNNMFVRELHTGLVKATYFMGAGGPAYRRDDANGGTVRWYLYDGLGSVLGEVDPQGNITARRKYDVYGATRAGSDAGTSKHKFVGSLGHPSEDETGLIYMQARYYDPVVGHFASQDSARHRNNWYVYANNDPVNRIDRNGRMDEAEELITEDIDQELETSAAEPPSRLLYSSEHAVEELANWMEKYVGRSINPYDMDEVIELWDAAAAEPSSSGSWLVKTEMYNRVLYIVASDSAYAGEYEGIGRVVTVFSPFD